MNDELRFRILKLLTQEPDISQRALAQQLGLSLGKANYCLHALIDKGWVKVRNFRNSHNKLAYAYMLTPSGLSARAQTTVAFLRRKQEEYEQLERELVDLRREVAGMSSDERADVAKIAP